MVTTAFNQEVKKYYDNNTPIFIKIGRSAAKANIHRAVWGEGVKNTIEAMNHVNELIVEEALQIDISKPLSIMDLGCGVGAPLFYLGNKLDKNTQFTGVSISTVQIDFAKKFHQSQHNKLNCQFIEADFHDLPELPKQDIIFLIEAFVHSDQPELLIKQISKHLKPGGKLIICDDFLSKDMKSLSEKELKLIKDYKEGWQMGTTIADSELIDMMQREGINIEKNINLTPQLNLWTFRDKLANFSLFFYKLLPFKSLYWESIKGGDALQKALLQNVINYKYLVFTKP